MEEKRLLKEKDREVLIRQDFGTSRLCETPVYLSKKSDLEELPRIPRVASFATPKDPIIGASPHLPELPLIGQHMTTMPTPPHSDSFARGRGLADLEGRLNGDAAKRRQQQMELQVSVSGGQITSLN